MVLEILAKYDQGELSGRASPRILASKGIGPGSYLHERTTSAFQILELRMVTDLAEKTAILQWPYKHQSPK